MSLNELKLRLSELSVIVERYYNIAPWTNSNRIVLIYNDGITKDSVRGDIVIYVDDENNIKLSLTEVTYDINDEVLFRKHRAIAELIDISGQGATNKQRFIDTILEFSKS